MASHFGVSGISALGFQGSPRSSARVSAPSGASPAGDGSLLNCQATVQLSGVNGQFNPRGRTVALTQNDLLRLLESLCSADGLELVREVAERLLQELIEAEATTQIGAEWGEHTDARTTWRNGHREKTVTTRRPRQSPRLRHRDIHERGLPDPRGPGRTARRLPDPPTGPHPLPLPVPRRHLRQGPRRPPHRPPGDRHRHSRHPGRRPGSRRGHGRRQRRPKCSGPNSCVTCADAA